MCNITRAFTFHLNFLATVPAVRGCAGQTVMMGRGGEIILDTNGITQVGAYQHQHTTGHTYVNQIENWTLDEGN